MQPALLLLLAVAGSGRGGSNCSWRDRCRMVRTGSLLLMHRTLLLLLLLAVRFVLQLELLTNADLDRVQRFVKGATL
jgi:hypothetical protein